MLVLSRKVGQTIEIGSDITLVVTRTAGGRVQIGIDAPREVAVRRGELTSEPRFTSDDGKADVCCKPFHQREHRFSDQLAEKVAECGQEAGGKS